MFNAGVGVCFNLQTFGIVQHWFSILALLRCKEGQFYPSVISHGFS